MRNASRKEKMHGIRHNVIQTTKQTNENRIGMWRTNEQNSNCENQTAEAEQATGASGQSKNQTRKITEIFGCPEFDILPEGSFLENSN